MKKITTNRLEMDNLYSFINEELHGNMQFSYTLNGASLLIVCSLTVDKDLRTGAAISNTSSKDISNKKVEAAIAALRDFGYFFVIDDTKPEEESQESSRTKEPKEQKKSKFTDSQIDRWKSFTEKSGIKSEKRLNNLIKRYSEHSGIKLVTKKDLSKETIEGFIDFAEEIIEAASQ